MQDPKRVTIILLALVVLGIGFLDYWDYSVAYHNNADTFMDVLNGTAPAPNQYRIGVIGPAGFLMRHTSLGLRHILAAIDILTGWISVFTLFFLLRRSPVYRKARADRQWFLAAAFIVLVQFYLPWVTWYQRPETLTTASLVALSLLLLSVRIPFPATTGIVATAGAQILLAIAQAFVRADVALALYAGVFLASLPTAGDGMSLPRRLQIAVAAVAVFLAAGIQYALMHIVYPHAKYGADTPVFQLALQFKEPARLIAFTFFIPPYAWLIHTLFRGRLRVDAPAAAMVVASAIFMVMWWVLGRVEEVRIFLPFALALVPLTVTVACERWLGVPLEARKPVSYS